MRKLPVFLVIDVSESMIGEAHQRLEAGLGQIVADLRRDPYCLETVWISAIAFAGKARTLTPLTELSDFAPPSLPVGGGTSLGRALEHLMGELDRRVARPTQGAKGDFRPLVFLMTDGRPTDNPEPAIRRWKERYASWASLVAVSIGGGAEVPVLKRVADEVFAFDDAQPGAFTRFIRWITASVSSSSRSIPASGRLTLAKMDDNVIPFPERTATFGLDDRYAVFVGRCAATKAAYVVKYERHMGRLTITDPALAEIFRTRNYLLQSCTPLKEDYFALCDDTLGPQRMNSTDLIGQPDCPHCNAPYTMAVCGLCGGVHCLKGEGESICPWCGRPGTYERFNDKAGISIGRGQG